MEEEEREAQSAKLQELIRRGGPQDLQEANKLMKVMAGYDTRNKTDWRAKAAEEVGRIQQKARILEEMLQGYKQGDHIKEGDVFEVSPVGIGMTSESHASQELANALQSAQPKIQKMCEEDSEDHEAVAKLFEINDSIHRTIERYKLFKKGDIEGANQIPQGTLGRSGAGVSQGPNNTLNLIDFGDSEPAPAAAQPSEAPKKPASTGHALEDDLLGLSLGGDSYGQSGSIALGGSNGSGMLLKPRHKFLLTITQFLDCLECLFLNLRRSRNGLQLNRSPTFLPQHKRQHHHRSPLHYLLPLHSNLFRRRGRLTPLPLLLPHHDRARPFIINSPSNRPHYRHHLLPLTC
jgi:hypothetical protein